MYSMTGYGKAEYQQNGITLVVEIKTVNNRIFDFNAKTPRSFISLEDVLRKTVQTYIRRARVDLFITFIDKRENVSNLTVNIDRALNYYNASKEIAEKVGLENDVTVSTLLKSPEVIVDETFSNVEELQDVIIDTVKVACENLNKMRETEGAKLVSDLLSRMDTIAELRETIVKRAPLVALTYKEKLKERITAFLSDVNYDEARLLNEVAFYTDKVNIDEELTRLNSHINQFREIIKSNGEGKKLDFLMQEFNREANTICSKSNDITVTNTALSLKNEIEKVREQVQNLE